MPYKSAIQRKRDKQKAKDKKKYAAAQREKAQNKESGDDVAATRAAKAKENREKTKAFNSISEQNLDLASKVWDVRNGGKIYIGKRSNAEEEDYFMDVGFTHVLNVAAEIPIPAFYDANGIDYLHMACRDRTDFNILDALDQGVDYLKKGMDEKGTILCHCREGRSRSSSMVCGYLIKYEHMRMTSALASITARRHLVHPNSAFMTALAQYDEIHNGPVMESIENEDEMVEG